MRRLVKKWARADDTGEEEDFEGPVSGGDEGLDVDTDRDGGEPEEEDPPRRRQ